MTREDITTRLLVQKIILNLMQTADAETREEAKRLFTKPGQREVGELAGQDIGSVQLTKAREAWVVADEAAFIGWVARHRPDEIITETRQTVSPAFRKAILEAAKSGEVVDSDGVIEVPAGIIPRKGQPILTVTPAKGVEALVLDALGDAAVTLGLVVRGEIAA